MGIPYIMKTRNIDGIWVSFLSFDHRVGWGSILIKEKIQDKLEEKDLLHYDYKLCEDLKKHLSSLSIESRVVFPGTSECIHKHVRLEPFERLLTGSLKVYRKNFDFFDICEYERYSILYFGYVLERQTALPSTDFNVGLKVIKKGLFNKEIVGFKWVGGELAERLNSDEELMTMVKGIKKESPSLGVGGPVSGWGSTLHVYASKWENSITFWQPFRDPRELPSKEDIEIAEKVSEHIQIMTPAKL